MVFIIILVLQYFASLQCQYKIRDKSEINKKLKRISAFFMSSSEQLQPQDKIQLGYIGKFECFFFDMSSVYIKKYIHTKTL